MYLCKLNSVTGLIDLEADRDGFYAIPEFRLLLQEEDGLKKLTCVALVVDYETPIRNYGEKEKPLKAQDIVFNSRKSVVWNSDSIQEALIAYSALQFDLDLDEKRMLDEMRRSKQQEIDAAEDTSQKLRLINELGAIKTHIEAFNKSVSGRDLYENSPVRNGYTLSRLEQKLENKNSFYHVQSEQRKSEQSAGQ